MHSEPAAASVWATLPASQYWVPAARTLDRLLLALSTGISCKVSLPPRTAWRKSISLPCLSSPSVCVSGWSLQTPRPATSHEVTRSQAGAFPLISPVRGRQLPHNHSCSCPKLLKTQGTVHAKHSLQWSVPVLAPVSCFAIDAAFPYFSSHRISAALSLLQKHSTPYTYPFCSH